VAFVTATLWGLLAAGGAWVGTRGTGSAQTAAALGWLAADVGQATAISVGTGQLTCAWTAANGDAVQVVYSESGNALWRAVTTTPPGGTGTTVSRPVATGLAASVTVTLTWSTDGRTWTSASTFTSRALAPPP
jgi:hypothetical protein